MSILKKLLSIAKKYKLDFCIAHNLTVSIKVYKVLGQTKSLIKYSHEAINSWTNILDHKLGINGLIFSYIDLAILYSDNKLFSLSLKYLKQAESLLPECKEPYNPFKKLYVAFAVVYEEMNERNTSKKYYSKVIKKAKDKKDFMTLIAISVNMSSMLIDDKKNLKEIETKLVESLTISDDINEKIYKPYLYHLLGEVYIKQKKYNQAHKHLELSLRYFDEIKSLDMIPKILFAIGLLNIKQKNYDQGKKYLLKSLDKAKDINDNTLVIKVLEQLCEIDENNHLFKQQLIKSLQEKADYNTKAYSEINEASIKQLSNEYDLLLKNQISSALQLEKESKKREEVSKSLRSVSEKEFLSKMINFLSCQKQTDHKLIQLCKERLNNTKGWNIFMKLFNEINPFFTKYIINKCPKITESELRVCNLIKMGFSTLEISEILSITQRGVEQHRYRIKKKLKLKNDLIIFLHSL